ncbi:phage tail tape measure protein [Burkholderia vietnamiensis]|uniref:phage tail tape measure protein n=1 Tax=Burkholderia vietnamiensis TaxID=60552 RepID=UPI000D782CCC|nr:phage tail tape measure protein [Burkholderia vietnamiensis]GBH24563.1 hypothetical protein BvRS1_16120 [Burkholderia vietnamiensis]
MSNNTQYNLTVNADGVYTALERAQTSFQKFGVTVDLTAQKAAASQQAFEESVKNTSDASVRAQRQVKRYMDSLVQQAQTAGQTSEDMLRLRAAQLGVSQAAEQHIAKIEQVKAAMSQQAQIARDVATAEREAAAAARDEVANQTAAQNLANAAQVANKKQADQLRAASADASAQAQIASERRVAAESQLAYLKAQAAASKANAAAVADAKAAEAAKTAAANAGAADRFKAWNTASQAAVQASKSQAAAVQAQSAMTASKQIADANAAKVAQIDAAKQAAAAQTSALQTVAAKSGGGGHGGGHAGISRELMVLSHEAAMGSWKNFGGSMMVLAEQINVLRYALTPVGGAFIAVGAAAALAYISIHNITKEQKELQGAMALTANFSDLTQGRLLVLSDAIHNSLGASVGDAKTALKELAKSGVVAGADLQGVAEGVVAYSKLSGQSADDTAKMFIQSYGSAGEAAQKGAETHHDLSKAQIELIKKMEESGDKAGAWSAFVQSATEAARVKVKSDLRDMGGDIETFGQQWARFWRGISGSGDELTKRLDNVRRLRAQKNDSDYNPMGVNSDEFDRQIAAEQKEIDKLTESTRKQEEHTKAVDRARAMDEQHAEAMKKTWTWQQKLADANTKSRAGMDARIEAAKAAGTFTKEYAAQQAKDLQAELAANAREFHGQKPAKIAAPSVHDALLEGITKQNEALTLQLSTHEKLTAAARVQLDAQLRIAAIEKIAANKRTAEDKRILADKQAILDAAAKGVEMQKQVDAQEELNKLKERGKQIDADILNYQQSQTEQYEAQLQAIGLGRKEQQRVASERSIRQKYLHEQAKLDRETPEALRGSDDYLAAQQRIAQGREKSLEDNRRYYADMDAMQADWMTGVTQGWHDYADAAANNMALAQTAFTDTTNTLQQTFDTFVKTGKLNFADMTRSILSDLAKIAAQKAIVGLVNTGISAVSGFMGGGADIPAGTASTTTGLNQYGFHLATGGAVSGPGTSTSDSIPAWLSDGEYVVKAAAVDRIGVHALDALNAGHSLGSVARFSSGGAVGSVARATRPAGGNTTLVDVTVSADGGGLDASDIPGLKADIQALIDARIAQKMKGQGGYAWQIANGSV